MKIEPMSPEIKQEIKERTLSGWDGLSTPPGWDQLISFIHIGLKSILPDYKILQIKEKFGGLRFYYEPAMYDSEAFLKLTEENKQKAQNFVNSMEAASYTVCSSCGYINGTVKLSVKKKGTYLLTLCNVCRDKYEYIVNEDHDKK